MRVVLQRVKHASVKIDELTHNEIEQGLLIFLGIMREDSLEDIQWLVKKIVGLRIFSDDDGKMNLNIGAIKGEILVISQFTLFASTKKGNRPSFVYAAAPDQAIPLYEEFIQHMRESVSSVKSGTFGADMKIELLNDGPVTILLDSKNRE